MARRVQSVKKEQKEPIVSPSLIKECNPSRPIPAEFRIGWEELMGVPINPAHYTGLSTLELDSADPTLDALLLQASQQFESQFKSTDHLKENDCQGQDSRFEQLDNADSIVDVLLLEASQQFESTGYLKENNCPQRDSRFGQPQNESDIKRIQL